LAKEHKQKNRVLKETHTQEWWEKVTTSYWELLSFAEWLKEDV